VTQAGAARQTIHLRRPVGDQRDDCDLYHGDAAFVIANGVPTFERLTVFLNGLEH
jgi:hypothetical protein